MQYKVPQNTDIEDRVIGPLSLRQFMIILIGAGIIMFLYFLLVGFLRPVFYLIALIIGFGSVAIAFADYGGQKFEDFIFSVLQTISKPRKRVWKKHEEIPQVVKAKPQEKSSAFIKEKKPLAEAHDDLERLAEMVDSGGYVMASQKDRNIGITAVKAADEGIPDILAATETPNIRIDNQIDAASKIVEKREPLISEVAKVSPNKQFQYDKIETV